METADLFSSGTHNGSVDAEACDDQSKLQARPDEQQSSASAMDTIASLRAACQNKSELELSFITSDDGKFRAFCELNSIQLPDRIDTLLSYFKVPWLRDFAFYLVESEWARAKYSHDMMTKILKTKTPNYWQNYFRTIVNDYNQLLGPACYLATHNDVCQINACMIENGLQKSRDTDKIETLFYPEHGRPEILVQASDEDYSAVYQLLINPKTAQKKLVDIFALKKHINTYGSIAAACFRFVNWLYFPSYHMPGNNTGEYRNFDWAEHFMETVVGREESNESCEDLNRSNNRNATIGNDFVSYVYGHIEGTVGLNSREGSRKTITAEIEPHDSESSTWHIDLEEPDQRQHFLGLFKKYNWLLDIVQRAAADLGTQKMQGFGRCVAKLAEKGWDILKSDTTVAGRSSIYQRLSAAGASIVQKSTVLTKAETSKGVHTATIAYDCILYQHEAATLAQRITQVTRGKLPEVSSKSYKHQIAPQSQQRYDHELAQFQSALGALRAYLKPELTASMPDQPKNFLQFMSSDSCQLPMSMFSGLLREGSETKPIDDIDPLEEVINAYETFPGAVSAGGKSNKRKR